MLLAIWDKRTTDRICVTFYSLLGVSQRLYSHDSHLTAVNSLSTPFWEFQIMLPSYAGDSNLLSGFLLPFGSFLETVAKS